MKKTLLLLICSLSLIGCAASVSKSNTLKSVSLKPEVEPLPVVADLVVSEQKVTGEASGTITQAETLAREALTKALGQDPPSADRPDVLVGTNVFTEITDNAFLKLTVTGYPAYYTNFRTAKEEDLERLNIAKLDRKAPVLDEAQEESPPKKKQASPSKYGVRAAFNMNSFSTGHSDDDKHIDMGYGFGIGIAVSTPIAKILTFNPEFNFLYRGVYNYSYSDSYSDNGYNYTESMSHSMGEIALSVPLMLRVMPVGSVPFYVSAGVQFDVPFLSEVEYEYEYERERNGNIYDSYSDSGNEDFDDRAWFDVGIALGVGYHIMDNLVADFRFVIGLTSLSTESGDDSSLNQISLGVSYFF